MPHKPEDVDRGLKALVLNAGNAAAAARDTGLPHRTLALWRSETYRTRYEALRAEHEERIDRELAEDMQALVKQRLDLLNRVGRDLQANLAKGPEDIIDLNHDGKAVERLDRELRELSATDKNLATSLGILTQNNRSLRDKPAQVIEHRYDMAQVERAMQAALGQGESPAIDVESHEIGDSSEG